MERAGLPASTYTAFTKPVEAMNEIGPMDGLDGRSGCGGAW